MIRSRSPWFWAYIASSFVVLLLLLFLVADRLTEPSSQTSFEPIGSADTVEPVNEFVPADRSISDCISAIPKPGCGSEARGGWRQTLVLLAILIGLALIVWRVVVGARRSQLSQGSSGTTARGVLDDDPAS